MSRPSSLSKWKSEYCAPVVVAVTTAEVETISLKNGLLFHELLSSFGHLDGVNTDVRSGNQTITISNAHIRFERYSELVAKSAGTLEEHLKSEFQEGDVHANLPKNLIELTRLPPMAMTAKHDELIMRSLSFSEYEMISHPLLLLIVVSTSDVDPVGAMQELSSSHHVPAVFTTGQYDPDIHRVYLLLHDPHVAVDVDPIIIQRKMQSKFPPHHTKLLFINSLAPSAPNLQQPNMWSKFLIPTFFPQSNNSLASFDPSTLPRNPMDGKAVYGAFLSMEDFMAIRNFCIMLYQNEIVPCLERRIVTLMKIVADARKGVKNVLKSFWRKPREDANLIVKGIVRYRYDKIESQILQLADACFIVRDYENALSLYKLVREDFKADKSNLHLAHVCLMSAMCLLLTDAVGNRKEVLANIDAIMQIIRAQMESVHLCAYFAIVAAEMLLHPAINMPSEAAHLSILAASKAVKSNVLSGLLTEKSAIFFLTAGYTRKYALHEVIAGYKFHSCTDNEKISSHAITCFAAAMLIYEKEQWGDIKVKLYRIISEDCRKAAGGSTPVAATQQKALLFLLRIIFTTLSSGSGTAAGSGDGIDGRSDIGGKNSLRDCVVALNDLITKSPWGVDSICDKDLCYLNTAQVLLSEGLFGDAEVPSSGVRTVLRDLSIPSIDTAATAILDNDSSIDVGNLQGPAAEKEIINNFIIKRELVEKMECENKVIRECKASGEGLVSGIKKTAKAFYDIEVATYQRIKDLRRRQFSTAYIKKVILGSPSAAMSVAMGEPLQLAATLVNKLPIDMTVWNVSIGIERIGDDGKPAGSAESSFRAAEMGRLSLGAESETSVILSTAPLHTGTYKVSTLNWSFSDNIAVSETVDKGGTLLQKTAQNRLKRERLDDRSLYFTVYEERPKVSISFEKPLPPFLVSRQIYKTVLLLRNIGCAPATNLCLKSQHPGLIFALGSHSPSIITACNSIIDATGFSASMHPLPTDVVVKPGETLSLACFLRFGADRDAPTKPSRAAVGGGGAATQKVSLLLSYSSANAPAACFHSYFTGAIGVIPSINVSFTTSSTNDALSHALHCSVHNCFVESSLTPEASDESDYPPASSRGCDLKITGIWIFGGAREAINLKDFVAAENISIARGSRYMFSIPFTSFWNGNFAIRSYFDQETLYGKYLIMDKVEHRLRRELQSLIALKISKKKAKKDRPRTIAQIRLDNEASSSSSAMAEISLKDDDEVDIATGTGGDEGGHSAKSSSLVSNLFENFQDFFMVSLSFEMTVNGKVVKGLYNSNEMTISSSDRSQSRAVITPSTSGGNVVIDYCPSNSYATNAAIGAINALCNPSEGEAGPDMLFIALSHEKTVPRTPVVGGGPDSSATVPVTVSVFSRGNEKIAVSIESIDSRNTAMLASLPNAASAQQPVYWEGKTKFVDVVIDRGGSAKVEFSCTITKPGLFDLNRFRVTAKAVGRSSAPVAYTISGQSLVEVQ